MIQKNHIGKTNNQFMNCNNQTTVLLNLQVQSNGYFTSYKRVKLVKNKGQNRNFFGSDYHKKRQTASLYATYPNMIGQ